MRQKTRIAVAGIGYVGLSLAVLLAQNNDVTAVDVVQDKVDLVNNRKSPIRDEDIEDAVHIEPLEEVIDGLTKEIKQHHVKRLTKGKCTIELGLILEDMLTNLERVSDHCSNVAVEMIAIHEEGYDTHEYFNSLSPQKKALFDDEYEKIKLRYQLTKAYDTIEDKKEKGKKKKDKVKN